MGSYKLSEDAELDLIRIHQYGVRNYGEKRADQYYFSFFDHFDQLAEQPYLYQAVDHIREGYRASVCGVDTIYYCVNSDTIEIMNILGQQNRDEWL